MGIETVIYLTNTIICAIIAVLMTEAWHRGEHRSSLLYWMIAAWVMLVADMLFAARTLMPPSIGRVAPTLLVTIGQAVLLMGARFHAGLGVPRRLAVAVVAVHALALVGFYEFEPESDWRRITNGVIWAALAFWSYRALRRSPPAYWRSLTSPANVFAAHAAFHILRLALVVSPAGSNSTTMKTTIEIMGDLEVSFFMVALFVGLLIAHLKQRNEQLSSALAEVKALSGLLPICAWCKKVRDDDGYWQQVEDYFRAHTAIRFSHGMCTDCSEEFRKQTAKL